MRLLLLAGTGGAGATTVAAATARRAALTGARTLLLTTGADGAAELHDVAPGLARSPGLPEHLEAPGEARAAPTVRHSGVPDAVGAAPGPPGAGAVLAALGLGDLGPLELALLPGAGDVRALLAVLRAADEGHWDVVVVDGPPADRAAQVWALPELLLACLRRLLPMELRVERALAPGAPARDHVVEAAERLYAGLERLRRVLADPGNSVRVVLTPDAVGAARARRAVTACAAAGMRVDGAVVTRVPAGAHPVLDAFEAALGGLAVPVPLVRIPSPDDGDTHADADAPPMALDVLPGTGPTAPWPVERDGADLVLVLDAPLVSKADVDLARRGDDLVVTVGSFRRLLPLPAALRRCTVRGAVLRDGALRVRFTPDPDQWRPL